MFVLSRLSVFVLVCMSSLFLSGFGLPFKPGSAQQVNNMCHGTFVVLCVKDVLEEIKIAAIDINNKVNDIEKFITIKQELIGTFHKQVNWTKERISANLPMFKNYDRFNRENNIDKNDFVRLIEEIHTATSYYYNSIKNVIDLENDHGANIDELSKIIRNKLRDEIICKSRSILRVYSKHWLPIDEVGRIQFPKPPKPPNLIAPSILHSVHSFIIAQLLGEWMQRIDTVIVNLEKKLV